MMKGTERNRQIFLMVSQ